jgi:hypothetical protein
MAANRRNAQQAAAKWRRRMQESQQEMRDGVQALNEAPSRGAVRQKDRMKAAFIQSVDNGTWQRNTEAVTLQDYQTAMTQYGIARAIEGAGNKEEKTREAFAELYTYEDRVLAEINRMPNATAADRKARMNKWFDEMAKFKEQRGRRGA